MYVDVCVHKPFVGLKADTTSAMTKNNTSILS